MDRFEQMRNYVRVVDAGSITRAASLSHIAKSAVSRRLSELEERLGVQLINRTTRRMTLTEAGQRFYEHCNRLLGELEEAEAAVISQEAALSGRIRLAAPTVFGRRHLGPAIIDFMAEHPAIDFDIEFNDRHVDIVEEGFDLAVRIARLSDSGMIARRLATITAVIAASPAYWDKHGRPRRPAELAEHGCLQYSYQPAGTWRYRAPDGEYDSVRLPVKMQANNGDFILDAAIAGHGVIRQPRFICHEAIAAGLLEPVLGDYQWLDVAAYAVYPATRHLPQRLREFVNFLAERWGDCPDWENC
ncbi:MAG: LysR family transcriptional regulator [Gammaproteobacteria bacterium]